VKEGKVKEGNGRGNGEKKKGEARRGRIGGKGKGKCCGVQKSLKYTLLARVVNLRSNIEPRSDPLFRNPRQISARST